MTTKENKKKKKEMMEDEMDIMYFSSA